MESTKPTTNTGRARAGGRAWWQWVIGGGLLLIAGLSAVVRIAAHFERELAYRPHDPIPLKLSAHMQPVDRVPVMDGEFAQHNLLLITLDTTRADRLGCYGHADIETPHLDRLAHEGLLFTHAYAPAPVTLPSHATMLTGLHPFHHGARVNALSYLDEENVTLAEVLRDAGYDTGAFLSAYVLDRCFGTAQGFETFDCEGNPTTDFWGAIAERRGDLTCDRALAWLRSRAGKQRPFFAWVHFFDPHWAYTPPPPYDEQYRHMPYDGEIAFMDAQVGRLIDELDDLGVAERTLVIVAGDHGEGLLQHDEATHGCLVYNSTLHVPFMLHCGDAFGGQFVDHPVGLVDLMPTALALLGMSAPADLDGRPLNRPDEPPRRLVAETLLGLAEFGWAPAICLYRGSDKYVYTPIPELFNVAADPFETRNLIEQRPELAAELHAELEAFYGGDLAAATSLQDTRKLAAEEMAHLEALGYVVGHTDLSAPEEDRPDPKTMMPLLREVCTAFDMSRSDWLPSAIDSLERIVAEHPDFYLARSELATAYKLNEDYDRARHEYEQCLEQRPQSVVALVRLSEIAELEGQVQEAIDYGRQVLELYPQHVNTLNRLGHLLHGQGRLAEGNEMYARSHAIVPGDRATALALARGREHAGDLPGGIDVLAETLALHPDATLIRSQLARLLKDTGRFGQAIRVLREGMKRQPDHFEFAANLALVLLSIPDGGQQAGLEATAIMERLCRETDYKNVGYVHTLSKAYARLGRFTEAAGLAERARTLAQEGGRPELAQVIAHEADRYAYLAQQTAPATQPADGPVPPPADDVHPAPNAD